MTQKVEKDFLRLVGLVVMLKRDDHERIVLEAQRGDPQAEEVFLEIVEAIAFALVRHRWRIGEDHAEDLIAIIVQGVHLYVVRRKTPIQKTLRKVVNQIARRRRADMIEEEKRRAKMGQQIEITGSSSNQVPGLRVKEAIVENVAQKELASTLSEELGKLSERHRAAVALHDLRELTFREVAEALKVSVPEVKGWYYHALKLLRKSKRVRRLGEEFFPGG